MTCHACNRKIDTRREESYSDTRGTYWCANCLARVT